MKVRPDIRREQAALLGRSRYAAGHPDAAPRSRHEPHGASLRASPDRPSISKEPTLAQQRPSFLKRQKEQARLARAAEKRSARADRKLSRAAGEGPDGLLGTREDLDALMSVGEQGESDARDDDDTTR